MPLKINALPLPGLLEIQSGVFGDERGNFFESYSLRDFKKAGITCTFVQDNQSYSTRGVLRGLHFQKKHPQAKLVRLVSGRVLDVVLDLRRPSPAFGKACAIVLDAGKNNQLYIPAGLAHGFYVLSKSAVTVYKCSDFYYPGDEGGVLWKSPEVFPAFEPYLKAASEKDAEREPLVSEKDAALPPFDPKESYFDMAGRFCGRNCATGT